MSKDTKELAAFAAPASQEEKSAKLIAMQEELAVLELEAKRLEVAEKKANLVDIQERLAERQLGREKIRQSSITNGATLKALADADRKQQARCNHKKGGNGAAGLIGGQGDSTDYAIHSHTMLNGDVWIRCLRCGKTWKPQKRDWFATVEEYVKALAEYEAAKNFPTKNAPSSSQQFRFSDNGDYFREVTKDVTLR